MCALDLLEKGRTTGQAARMLYDPPHREKLELEAAKAKQAEEQSKMSKKGGGKATDTKKTDKAKVPEPAKVSEPVQSPGINPDEEEDEEEEEEMDEGPMPTRYWYSLVCYGLPNLVVVTQPGKS